MKKETLVTITCDSYEKGIAAVSRIEVMKRVVTGSKYGITREDIAAILGFDLPEESEGECE